MSLQDAGHRSFVARERWLLAAVLLLAAAVRVWGLGTLAFEQDELYTLRDAADFGASAGDGPGILGRPLYYLLQHALLLVLPAEPWLLRAPAALFGLLGVAATWWAGRRLIGPVGGLAAAALVAISPWHIYHSQFARYWTLLYLLAVLLYAALPPALDGSSRWARVVAVTVGLLAALTHPTFLFALVGVAIATTIVTAEGHVRAPVPRAGHLVHVWAPMLAPLALWYGLVRLLDGGRALRNPGAFGGEWSSRLVPAIIQWAGPVVVVAALVGVVVLWRRAGTRRLAATCAGGLASVLLLLLLAGTRTAVFADYGTAALPLLFLAAGAAVQRAHEGLGGRFAAGFVAILLAGVLPQTVSHLADGTRFDFRPAHAAIREVGAAPVVAWPVIVHRYYAPDLSVIESDGDPAKLDQVLAESGGFWAISAIRRRGLVPGGPRAQRWIDEHCRRRGHWEAARLDYRRYAVALDWCGPTDPRPSRAPSAQDRDP
ncbi:MAG: glycosyltransferase family 39 protein [Gemmatimonadota bacterium]